MKTRSFTLIIILLNLFIFNTLTSYAENISCFTDTDEQLFSDMLSDDKPLSLRGELCSGNIADANFSGLSLSDLTQSPQSDSPFSIFSEEKNTDLLDYFHEETENFAEEIDITEFNICADEFEECYELLLFCSPRSYYLIADTGSYYYFYPSTTVNADGEEIIECLYPIYQLDIYDDDYYIDYSMLNEVLPWVKTTQEHFDALTEEIMADIPDGSNVSDLTKLIYIHDYIIQNYSYDFDNAISDEYGNPCKRNNIRFIPENLPVACQTYAILFNYLAMNEGIEASFVTSVDQYGYSYHTWNIVKLAAPQNGNVPKWYHIDVTWDDTSRPDGSGSSMKYFLLSDSKMRESHSNVYDGDRYITYPELNLYFGDEFDNSPWVNAGSQIVEFNNSYYYLEYDVYTGQTHLNRFPVDNNDSSEIVYSYNGLWMYADTYSGLVLSDNKLYFNTAYDIIEYDILSGTADVIPIDCNNENIYSCYSDNGRLYYNLSSDIYTSDVTSVGPIFAKLEISEPEILFDSSSIEDPIPEMMINFRSDLPKNIRVVVKETSPDGVSLLHLWNADNFTGSQDAAIELSNPDNTISVYIWNEAMAPYQEPVILNESE